MPTYRVERLQRDEGTARFRNITAEKCDVKDSGHTVFYRRTTLAEKRRGAGEMTVTCSIPPEKCGVVEETPPRTRPEQGQENAEQKEGGEEKNSGQNKGKEEDSDKNTEKE